MPVRFHHSTSRHGHEPRSQQRRIYPHITDMASAWTTFSSVTQNLAYPSYSQYLETPAARERIVWVYNYRQWIWTRNIRAMFNTNRDTFRNPGNHISSIPSVNSGRGHPLIGAPFLHQRVHHRLQSAGLLVNLALPQVTGAKLKNLLHVCQFRCTV